MNNNLQHILKLTIPERIILVEEIWNSIASDSNKFQLSKEQKKILDQEMEDYIKNPEDVLTWEQVKQITRTKK
ncbi:MAG: hypothetical protein A2046_07065 [Bacteroidetes bacterium GWA2_30_7]|nr:MAG: hypothetical protein A2046_07065 [Bacteroidetes bacterium GWA2_30_7]